MRQAEVWHGCSGLVSWLSVGLELSNQNQSAQYTQVFWVVFLAGVLLALAGFCAWPLVRSLVLAPNTSPDQHEWRITKYLGKDQGFRIANAHAPAGGKVVLEFRNSAMVAHTMWLAPKSGSYQLRLAADDFGSVMIDARQVQALPRVMASENSGLATVKLAAGWHLVSVEIFNGAERGWFTLAARSPGQKDLHPLSTQLHDIDLGNLDTWFRLLTMAPYLGLLGLALLLAGGFPLARRGSLGRAVEAAATWIWPPPDARQPAGLGGFLVLWLGLALLAVLLETSFLLSKESVLGTLGPGGVMVMIAGAVAWLSLPGLIMWALALLAVGLLGGGARVRAGVQGLLLLIWALCLVAVALTHLGIFFYTSWGLNLVDLRQLWAWAPGLLGLALIPLALRLSRRPGLAWWSGVGSGLQNAALGLLILVWGVTLVSAGMAYAGLASDLAPPAAGVAGKMPNVIFFASDGLDRSRLGLYGAARQTTPNLSRLAQTSTLYTQNFVNCPHTRGSVASMLTGVEPADSRVLYPPDVLIGLASLRHLPGILAGRGYYCADFADEVYGCAESINILGGFHEQNGVMLSDPQNRTLLMLHASQAMEAIMVGDLLKRVAHAVAFMAGISDQLIVQRDSWKGMEMPGFKDAMSDEDQVQRLIKLIATKKRPIFAHMHLMKTHGPYYGKLHQRAFSSGQQTEADHDDFYDDAILTQDYFLGQIVQALKDAGKWDNTLLVFHTDHGRHYERDAHRPNPLLVHLPGQNKGKVYRRTVQHLDLAPSVLISLGQKPPAWMKGLDIFSGQGMEDLPVRIVYTLAGAGNSRIMGPPLRGVTFAQVIRDGLCYSLDMSLHRPRLGPVEGWTGKVLEPSPENIAQSHRLLTEYLTRMGVNASRLKRGAVGAKP